MKPVKVASLTARLPMMIIAQMDAELAALNDNIDDEDIIEDDRVNIRV